MLNALRATPSPWVAKTSICLVHSWRICCTLTFSDWTSWAMMDHMRSSSLLVWQNQQTRDTCQFARLFQVTRESNEPNGTILTFA